jgi:hypothetical protein
MKRIKLRCGCGAEFEAEPSDYHDGSGERMAREWLDRHNACRAARAERRDGETQPAPAVPPPDDTGAQAYYTKTVTLC